MDLTPLDQLVDSAIAQATFPGAVYGIWHDGHTEIRARGRYTYCPDSPAVLPTTIWDLASVSKVIGTTTQAMRAHAAGLLDIEAPVVKYLPNFGQNGKSAITIRNLMVHDSGLIAFRPYHLSCTTPQEVIARIEAEPLTYPTGTKMVYSDLNMITLARILEGLAGAPLDFVLHESVFRPLELGHTGYFRSVGPQESPAQLDPSRCAPTEAIEPWRIEQRRLRRKFLESTRSEHLRAASPPFPDQPFYIQGEVHDPTAMTLGGVAGHAGLFSTAADLLRLVSALMAGQIVARSTVDEFTRRQSDRSTRALGWDTKSVQGSSAGDHFGARSFGHTGYTGTSIWVDPDRPVAVVLLTNRVHPTSDNLKIASFRPRFHNAVIESIGKSSGASSTA